MTNALNMTMPLKQDAASKGKLTFIKEHFAEKIQPEIDAALRKSRLVHFARVVVIEDKYIQILTEYDGDRRDYTEFFRKELQGVFETIFSIVDGVPAWPQINTPDAFYDVSKKFNVKALGKSTDDPDEGWLFSAYPGKTVDDILSKL